MVGVAGARQGDAPDSRSIRGGLLCKGFILIITNPTHDVMTYTISVKEKTSPGRIRPSMILLSSARAGEYIRHMTPWLHTCMIITETEDLLTSTTSSSCRFSVLDNLFSYTDISQAVQNGCEGITFVYWWLYVDPRTPGERHTFRAHFSFCLATLSFSCINLCRLTYTRANAAHLCKSYPGVG